VDAEIYTFSRAVGAGERRSVWPTMKQLTIVTIFAVLTLLWVLAELKPPTRLSSLLLRSFGPIWLADRSPRRNYLAAAAWFGKGSIILFPLCGLSAAFMLLLSDVAPSVVSLTVFFSVAYLAIMSVAGAMYCGIRAIFASNRVPEEPFNPQTAE
jgi:hypothetical protein